MIDVIGTRAGRPIRRGMTLFITNEIAGLVVFWARSVIEGQIGFIHILRTIVILTKIAIICHFWGQSDILEVQMNCFVDKE